MKVRAKNAKPGIPVAVITGGSEGIGAACVNRFLDEGWRVSTISLHGPGTESIDSRVLRLTGDIASEQVRQELIRRTLDQFGRIDLLVNNAGVGLYAPVTATDIDLLRRMFEVNFVAVLRFTSRFLASAGFAL